MSIINKLPKIVKHEHGDCSRCREAFLYTTPYIAYSILLSGIYIFALKAGRKIRAGGSLLYSEPRQGTELPPVVGEVHHPREQMPSETPRWLVIPEWGLFTGITIVGAVGSRKTASCMYAFAEQILAYRAEDPRQAHRRHSFGSERRLLRESAGNPRGARPPRRLGRNRPRVRVPLQKIDTSLREQLPGRN
jgi:hypothetical protein